MNYYVAPAVNDAHFGTRPNVSIPWVGAYDAATNTFLIATSASAPPTGSTAVTDLAAECTKRGLQVSDVLRWRC